MCVTDNSADRTNQARRIEDETTSLYINAAGDKSSDFVSCNNQEVVAHQLTVRITGPGHIYICSLLYRTASEKGQYRCKLS